MTWTVKLTNYRIIFNILNTNNTSLASAKSMTIILSYFLLSTTTHPAVVVVVVSGGGGVGGVGWLTQSVCGIMYLQSQPDSSWEQTCHVRTRLTAATRISQHNDGLRSRQQDPHRPRYRVYSEKHGYDKGPSWGRPFKVYFMVGIWIWIILDPVSKLP